MTQILIQTPIIAQECIPVGMRTAHTLTIKGGPAQGVPAPGGVSAHRGVCSGWGVPCDISHHAFDVTCMLS